MKKEKWGSKHRCIKCPTIFYDLGKIPAVCPKCKTSMEGEGVSKSRKSRQQNEEKIKSSLVQEEDNFLDDALSPEDLSEDDLLEDASDLGDDGEEVSEVLEDAETSETEED